MLMCLDPGLLFTEENEIYIGNSGELTLECTLAGYVEELTINDHLIDWTFNGQPLTTDSNYIISVASRECPPYGACGLGFLRIMNLGSENLGDYVCSFGDVSQTITLLEGNLLVSQLTQTLYNTHVQCTIVYMHKLCCFNSLMIIIRHIILCTIGCDLSPSCTTAVLVLYSYIHPSLHGTVMLHGAIRNTAVSTYRGCTVTGVYDPSNLSLCISRTIHLSCYIATVIGLKATPYINANAGIMVIHAYIA